MNLRSARCERLEAFSFPRNVFTECVKCLGVLGKTASGLREKSTKHIHTDSRGHSVGMYVRLKVREKRDTA